MKPEIHPEYKLTTVVCTCGNTFDTRSAIRSETLRLEVCSECHPFYTGKHRVVDTAGQIDKFMKKYGSYKKNASQEGK